ncbi:MAG TPA: glycosyltransferase [Acidimicrobiia bacterium]|nr:glycosyltransferase [Acidimicrobiia bacterium]
MGDHVVFLSLHTCPLVQPGRGWAGGMNVYVDELARAMAREGIEVDVFTRRHDREVPESITVEPGFSLHHVEAGPPRELDPGRALRYLGVYADAVIDRMGFMGDVCLVHSHYWLSGWAGLRIKRYFGLPHVHSSHTLGRVNEAHRRGDETPVRLLRIAAEQEVIEESDVNVVSDTSEREDLITRYGADPSRISIVTPGVDHDLFVPGVREAARIRLGWPDVTTVLYVGRIQPVKGPDLAIEAFAEITNHFVDARLVLVGAPSGDDGAREMERLQGMVKRYDLGHLVTFAEPVPHRQLADVYRAADLILVPSRSESFGLVAAEAQASGVPVVAASVGGLRTVVGEGSGGVLVGGWDPNLWAETALQVLIDPVLRSKLEDAGPRWAERFSWESTVAELTAIYEALT